MNDEYFKKIADNKWLEYHEGKSYASFSEYSSSKNKNGDLKVVLKGIDGIFVFLTKGISFWSMYANNFTDFLTYGDWEKKVESNNKNQANECCNIKKIYYFDLG